MIARGPTALSVAPEPARDAAHPFESTILAYLHGRACDRRAVENHLDACDECRELIGALAQTSLVAPRSSALYDDDAPTHERDAPERALPRPGDVLASRYRLGPVLGEGAMGIVYEATDLLLESAIAIKVFWPRLMADPRLEESIRKETVLGRKIQHANVRRVFDVSTSDGLTYLTMDLVHGKTLEDVLRAGQLADALAVDVLEQVSHALTAAHAAGVVHRDLKPSNIAVEPNGRVIVMDFGLARDVNAEQSRFGKRALVGTPAYWSPEQSRGEPATHASDIYSLGLIAYRLFSGRHFSLGEPGVLPPRFRPVVARAIATYPSERYPSAEAFRVALVRAASHNRGRALSVLGLAAAALLVVGVVAVGATSARVLTASRTTAEVAGVAATADHAHQDMLRVAEPAANERPVPVSELPTASDSASDAPPVVTVTATTRSRARSRAAAGKTSAAKDELAAPTRPVRPIDRETPYAKPTK